MIFRIFMKCKVPFQVLKMCFQVGVPIEFDSVCDVMKFLQSKNTLNKPTQVLGIAVGKKEDIYPIDGIARYSHFLFIFIKLQRTLKSSCGLNGLIMTPLVTVGETMKDTQRTCKH